PLRTRRSHFMKRCWLFYVASLHRWQDLPLEVVAGLVEVEVASLPLRLSPLRIHVVGTEMLFGRLEAAPEIVVEGQGVRIEPAEVEPLQRLVIGRCRMQAAGGHV